MTCSSFAREAEQQQHRHVDDGAQRRRRPATCTIHPASDSTTFAPSIAARHAAAGSEQPRVRAVERLDPARTATRGNTRSAFETAIVTVCAIAAPSVPNRGTSTIASTRSSRNDATYTPRSMPVRPTMMRMKPDRADRDVHGLADEQDPQLRLAARERRAAEHPEQRSRHDEQEREERDRARHRPAREELEELVEALALAASVQVGDERAEHVAHRGEEQHHDLPDAHGGRVHAELGRRSPSLRDERRRDEVVGPEQRLREQRGRGSGRAEAHELARLAGLGLRPSRTAASPCATAPTPRPPPPPTTPRTRARSCRRSSRAASARSISPIHSSGCPTHCT